MPTTTGSGPPTARSTTGSPPSRRSTTRATCSTATPTSSRRRRQRHRDDERTQLQGPPSSGEISRYVESVLGPPGQHRDIGQLAEALRPGPALPEPLDPEPAS